MGDQVLVDGHLHPEAVEQGKPSVITMQGQQVFRWATGFIADAAQRCVDAAGVAPGELDLFVPHQANDRITDTLLRYLKLPENVVVARTIRQFGNNSAATIPMAMDALLASGEAKSGDTALTLARGLNI